MEGTRHLATGSHHSSELPLVRKVSVPIGWRFFFQCSNRFLVTSTMRIYRDLEAAYYSTGSSAAIGGCHEPLRAC
jgi:hypothetical protein